MKLIHNISTSDTILRNTFYLRYIKQQINYIRGSKVLYANVESLLTRFHVGITSSKLICETCYNKTKTYESRYLICSGKSLG